MENYCTKSVDVDVENSNIKISETVMPNDNTAYVILNWDKNNFDLVLYNVSTGDILRYYNPHDEFGNALENGYSYSHEEKLKVSEISVSGDQPVYVYVVNSQGTKEKIKEASLSVDIIINGESSYNYSCDISSPTLWTVGYFQNGQFTASEEFNTEFESLMWANVVEDQNVCTLDNMTDGIWMNEG